MLKNAIIILPLLLILNSKKLIKIPFYKKEQLTASMSPNEIIQNLEDNIFNTQISIGTPYQKLELNLRTDDHFTYVISEDSNFEEDMPPDDLQEYSNSTSSTYVKLNQASFLYYLFKECYYMKEKVEIGNISINNLTLIQAVDIKYSKDLTYDSGILGLGIVNYYETSAELHSNFIVNLKEKELIDNYNFFFHFEENDKGYLIIGGEPFDYDSNLYKNKINTFARQPTYSTSVYWGFMVDDIKYNGKKINKDSAYAKIKLNFGFIRAGENVKNVLKEQYFNYYLNNGICREIKTNTLYTNFVCKKGKFDKTKIGTLEIFNWEFSIPFKFDLSKLFYDINEDSYFLVQFEGSNFITLGEPFIKQYNPVFNQDTKMIGIYTEPVKKQNPKNKKYFAVLMIMCILTFTVIVILLFVLKYKKKLNFKKMKGIELVDENYEYVSMPKH